MAKASGQRETIEEELIIQKSLNTTKPQSMMLKKH